MEKWLRLGGEEAVSSHGFKAAFLCHLPPTPTPPPPPESGTILKALSTASRSLRGCYLEELHVLPPGRLEPLRSLRILHSARALFVGLSDRVLRVPLERCSAYRSQG